MQIPMVIFFYSKSPSTKLASVLKLCSVLLFRRRLCRLLASFSFYYIGFVIRLAPHREIDPINQWAPLLIGRCCLFRDEHFKKIYLNFVAEIFLYRTWNDLPNFLDCLKRCLWSRGLSMSPSSVFFIVTDGFVHGHVTPVGTQTGYSTHGSELTWNSLMSCSGPVAVATSLERHDETDIM